MAWDIAYNSSTQSILIGDTGLVRAYLQGYFLVEFLQLSMNMAGLSGDHSSYEQRSRAHNELGVTKLGVSAMGAPQCTQPYGKVPRRKLLRSPAGFGARSVVLEIAHRNESFAALHEEIAFGMRQALHWP